MDEGLPPVVHQATGVAIVAFHVEPQAAIKMLSERASAMSVSIVELAELVMAAPEAAEVLLLPR